MIKYLSNIIYLLATSSLLIGSIMTFNKKDEPDYFYSIGTLLFFINSIERLLSEIVDRKFNKKYHLYDTPLI
tara:strand:+ start:92 stop:307 length:216 start_codon:yes stop_codon:yes gene_type:complete